MNKSQFLRELDEENQIWEKLLSDIGEARMEQSGVAGHWSVKQIISHITGWRTRTVGRLEAAGRGQPEPPPPWPAHLQESPSDDDINAWFEEQARSRSLREVLDDSRAMYRRLRAAIEALPEPNLSDPARFPWNNGQPISPQAFFSHFHDEHEADMRAWLATQEK